MMLSPTRNKFNIKFKKGLNNFKKLVKNSLKIKKLNNFNKLLTINNKINGKEDF